MTTEVQHSAAIDRLRPLLEEGERQAAVHGRPVLVCASSPVEPIDSVRLFDAAAQVERTVWEQPAAGFRLTAVGVSGRITGRGPEGLSHVAQAWRNRVSSAILGDDESCPVAAPVALGGVAFDPAGRREGSPWVAYADAELVIPRFLFTSSQGKCWLTLSVVATAGCDVTAMVEETGRSLVEMLSGTGESAEKTDHESIRASTGDNGDDGWFAAVNAALTEIRGGSLEKVVLARDVGFASDMPFDAGEALRKLTSGYPSCTVFAFAREGTCFLGASPERLVRLQGRRLEAACLAGSRPRAVTAADDRQLGEALLADQKEQYEHALVVRAVREALEPLCTGLSMPESPSLLRMPNVQHLYTPAEGSTDGETTVLDAVERLNPTPATGGLPRGEALAFIRRTEPFDRGWYAGAVGWVDRTGGGEFVVAIRSALLQGNSAHLYAGCGIVGDSDPESEFEESCVKLQPLRWALGEL